jgi:hypothetical protein
MLLLEHSGAGTGSWGVHSREACRQNIQRNQVGAHTDVYALVNSAQTAKVEEGEL